MKKKIKRMTLKLEGEDCAMVIRGNGEHEIYIPAHEADDFVPEAVLAIMVLSFRASEETVPGLASQFRRYMDKIMPKKGDTIQ